MLCLHAGAAEPNVPSAEDMLSFLKIDRTERDSLMSGNIVSCDVGESNDRELAVAVIMFLPYPVEKVAEYVRTERLLAKDPDTTAYGEMTSPTAAQSLKGAKISADEAEELADVDPGTDFNLATAEIAAFDALKGQIRDDSKLTEAVNQKYRDILAARYDAYQKGGLSAIAPYDRGGRKFSSPGADLLAGLKKSMLISEHFPVLYKALVEYPQSQPPAMIHRFFWLNQKVEDRPTLILSHRMKLIMPGGAFLAERQFYVGHSYNALEILTGCFPAHGGTLVFYVNRTSTDQVAGFLSGLKHSIGRDDMKKEVIKGFQEIRDNIKKQ